MRDAPRLVIRDAEFAALPPGLTSAVARARDDGDAIHLSIDPARAHDAGAPMAASILVGDAQSIPRPSDIGTDTHGYPADSPDTPLRVVVIRGADNNQKIQATLTREGRTENCAILSVPDAGQLRATGSPRAMRRVLATRTVILFGLGSCGSAVAVELAKAGVGRFLLFDHDHLAPEDITRHACGRSDLGRKKVHAVADLLRNHHPDVEVRAYPWSTDGEVRLARDCMSESNLIIGATHEPSSRAWFNHFACFLRTPALFVRLTSHAAGGSIFRVRPGVGPCDACLEASELDRDEWLPRRRRRDVLPDYVSPAGRARFVKPGPAIDIAPVAQMLARLAIVELLRDSPTATTGLDEELEGDLFLWANHPDNTWPARTARALGKRASNIFRWQRVAVPSAFDCRECAQARERKSTRGRP